jgi:4a-hydroxytetrahydrobiopterin dehydratase
MKKIGYALVLALLIWGGRVNSAPQRLSPTELNKAVTQLQGWQIKEGKLRKIYQFKDFVDAFSFMTRVAFAAENLQHHPEWFNVYNKVTIELVTHDVGGISNLDIELASQIDRIYAQK